MLLKPISAWKAKTGGGATTPSVTGTPVNSQTSGSTPHTVTLVSSPKTIGNFQIVVCSSDEDWTFSTPSGWTAVRTVQWGSSGVLSLFAIYREITSGNQADTSVSIDVGGPTFASNCTAFEIADWGTVNTSNSDTATPGATTSHTGLSVTTTAANCLVMEFLAFRTSNGGTPPTPGAAYTDTNDLVMYGTQDKATAGATTGLSFTTVDSENGYPRLTVAIEP